MFLMVNFRMNYENKFKAWREEYKAEFICDENGKYIVGRSRKMSKSKYNVVTQMLFVTNTEQIPCVCKMF
jgi:hypothetical protein